MSSMFCKLSRILLSVNFTFSAAVFVGFQGVCCGVHTKLVAQSRFRIPWESDPDKAKKNRIKKGKVIY